MIHIEYLHGDLAADYLKREGAGLLGVLGFPAVPADCATTVPHASVAAGGPGTGPQATDFCEVWMSHAPVRHGVDGDIRFAISGDYLFGVLAMPQGAAAGALRESAERAYGGIFAMLARHGFPHAVRFWNYFPRINGVEGDMERYRLFNMGRGAAFENAGRNRAETIPAACALGTDSGDALTVYFVAAREPGLAVENPRQVSAYRYPPEHGPHSPTFSRAVLHPAQDASMLFVSGTASIVGHRTLHAGDVVAQARETLANLEALFAEAGRLSRPGAFPMREASYKVYVRHARDAPAVRVELAAALGADADVNLLRADICRADLLVEIEAIAYAGTAGERPRR
jgi:enamine deaminase RidA (YjgF/YER057c/UK114 family)